MTKPMRAFYFAMTVTIFVIAVYTASAQVKTTTSTETKSSAKEPPTAAQSYVVLTGQAIGDIIKELQSDNKTRNVISGSNLGCRIFIQHEKDVSKNPAEIHENADDIFIIMEGTATIILGGKLDTPNQTQPGEWRAPGITGGNEVKVSKGDMVIVPRGTPHKRITAGQDVTLIVIKAFTPVVK